MTLRRLLLAVVPLAACASAVPTATTAASKPVAAAVWWSPSLELLSPADIDERLKRPFEDSFDVIKPGPSGTMEHQQITDCVSYARWRDLGYEPQILNDLAGLKIEGALCQAIRLVREARPGLIPSTDLTAVSPALLPHLPATLGPQVSPAERERRQVAAAKGTSWATADPGLTLDAISAEVGVVKGPTWMTKLEILVRGDLDGDGVQDLLVRTVSSGTEGSWREVRLRLLRAVPGHPVYAVSAEYGL